MATEGAQQRQVTKQGVENLAYAAREVPKDAFGTPLVEISCAAAELIPTQQFGNVTVGPIIVRRWVPDGTDESIAAAIKQTQALCETAVADDRETVTMLLRQSSSGRAS